jgi:hypothetical protein
MAFDGFICSLGGKQISDISELSAALAENTTLKKLEWVERPFCVAIDSLNGF